MAKRVFVATLVLSILLGAAGVFLLAKNDVSGGGLIVGGGIGFIISVAALGSIRARHQRETFLRFFQPFAVTKDAPSTDTSFVIGTPLGPATLTLATDAVWVSAKRHTFRISKEEAKKRFTADQAPGDQSRGLLSWSADGEEGALVVWAAEKDSFSRWLRREAAEPTPPVTTEEPTVAVNESNLGPTEEQLFPCRLINDGPSGALESMWFAANPAALGRLYDPAKLTVGTGGLRLVRSQSATRAQESLVFLEGFDGLAAVRTRRVSRGPQLAAALRKSLLVGFGIGILVLVLAFSAATPKAGAPVATAVIFGLLAGLGLGFAFVFLPNAVRARPLDNYMITLRDGSAVLFAVDIATSAKLKIALHAHAPRLPISDAGSQRPTHDSTT